jgi:hypothetical protein
MMICNKSLVYITAAFNFRKWHMKLTAALKPWEASVIEINSVYALFEDNRQLDTLATERVNTVEVLQHEPMRNGVQIRSSQF